ncbi:MAG: hypothetical protein WC071_08225, partial [Victivallaceae bacterium]
CLVKKVQNLCLRIDSYFQGVSSRKVRFRSGTKYNKMKVAAGLSRINSRKYIVCIIAAGILLTVIQTFVLRTALMLVIIS